MTKGRRARARQLRWAASAIESGQHGQPVNGQAQAGPAWHKMLTASALATPHCVTADEVTMAKAAAM